MARTVNALNDEQRASLGIVNHDPAQTYDRVDRLFNKLCNVLDAERAGPDERVTNGPDTERAPTTGADTRRSSKAGLK